jgi:hypothetical protein
MSIPEWLRPTIMSLEQFLARPKFYNGVDLGGGVPPTRNSDGVLVRPPLQRLDNSEFLPIIGEVGTLDIVDGAITTLKLGLAAVDNARIAVDAIQGDVIAAGAITEAKIGAAAVTAAAISAGAITTAKLAVGAVTADTIAANAVTAGKILAGEIGTSHLSALAITADKIAANTITAAKLSTIGVEVGKWIRSATYVAGSVGWAIDGSGSAEFNNVTVRGTVVVGGGAVVGNIDGLVLESLSAFSAGGAAGPRSIKWKRSDTSVITASVAGNWDGLFLEGGTEINLTAPAVSVTGVLYVSGNVAVHAGNISSYAITTGTIGSYALTPSNYTSYAATAGHTHSSFNGLSVLSSPLFAFHGTTGSGANAFLSSFTGELIRSTSSQRYKASVAQLVLDHDTSVILGVSAKTWLSRLHDGDLGGSDDPNHRFGGFIAEEVAAADPLLATYGEDGLPEAINWPAVTAFLLEEVKRLRVDLDAL